MKKFISIYIVVLILLSTVLAGCGTKSQSPGSNVSKGNKISKGMSIGDIKKKYKTDTTTGIMPIYNVAYNKEFTFTFNSDLGEIDTASIISVYTDIKCLEESKVLTHAWPEDKDGKTSISIKPSAGFMPLTTSADNNKEGGYWGGAPIYYIKISYDFNSKDVKKLDKAIIVPFTVKSDLPVPNLTEEISKDGKLKLTWDKVDGAQKYNIYNATQMNLDKDNKPLSGAEKGYLGIMPRIIATVTANEWDDFFLDGRHGTRVVDTDYTSAQNEGVGGEYFVTAVKDKKESHLSVPVETPSFSSELPKRDFGNIAYEKFESVTEIPKTTKVEFINDSVQERNIIYDVNNIKINPDSYTNLKFAIEGTALCGYISVKMSEKDISIIKTNKPTDNTNGTVKPKNSTDQIPKPDVPTVISTDEKSNSQTSKNDVVKDVQDNTKKQVTEGDKQKVESPEIVNSAPVNANSAGEEYLALQMIATNGSISLKAFPELQNGDALQDTLLEVIYQNPMILGVKSYAYNYSTLTLSVKYNQSAEATTKKQNEIMIEAKKIVSNTVKSGMSAEEKRKAFYNYLNNATKYDKDALKNAEKNNFKEVDSKFDDSFTMYGIMVKKVGVCGSYAATYKLLCDLSSIECVVVTGTIQNVPHAWNKVKIDKEWLNVDNTNNLKNSGVNYFCYDTNDETATKLSYIESKEFCLDEDYSKFAGITNKDDYYTLNGLAVKDATTYSTKLEELLKKGDKSIVLRLETTLSDSDLKLATSKAFKTSSKATLDSATLGLLGTYVVVKTK